MLHAWVRISALALLLSLAGCDEFEQFRVLKSPDGVYATIAVPPNEGAFTVCLAEEPVNTCSRREAVFYSYRRHSGDEWWSARNVLTIRQEGGEVRKGPPDGPIKVGDHEVFLKLEYTPAPPPAY
jgi:hypothetical protein